MAKKLKNKINWPALSTVLFNVVPDSTFNIGSGITTITPNLVSLLWGMPADSYEANRILYPEKTVVNPHMGLNTIIYNPNTNNRDAVSLDALHVMHDSPIYLELYKQYVESLPQGFEPLMKAANDEFGNEGVTIIEKYLKGLPLLLEEQEVIEPIYDALLRRLFAPDYMRNVPHGYQDKAILPIIPSINMSGDEAIRRYMESYPLKEVTITPENKHEDGGPLHPDWNELSMRDRAAYIRMGVANGYKNIEDIINVYNEFRKGGAKLNPRESYIYEELPRLLQEAGVTVRVTSGYRKPGVAGKLGSKSYHTRHQAVDIVPSGTSTWDDIKDALYNNPKIRSYMLSNGYGLLDETNPDVMRQTGATGKHFHIGKDTNPARQYAAHVSALLDNIINNPRYVEQLMIINNLPTLNMEAMLPSILEDNSIAMEGVLPEVVITPNRPKLIDPQALYADMQALAPALTPIEAPTIPSITEKVTALSDARNTFLQNELENSIRRNQLIDDDFSREKLKRDMEDLRFYRNMAANGGNLYGGGGFASLITVPTSGAVLLEPVRDILAWLPYTSTAIDIENAVKDPSASNLTWAGVSVGLDLLTAGIYGKMKRGLNRINKAISAAETEAASATKRAEKAKKVYNLAPTHKNYELDLKAEREAFEKNYKLNNEVNGLYLQRLNYLDDLNKYVPWVMEGLGGVESLGLQTIIESRQEKHKLGGNLLPIGGPIITVNPGDRVDTDQCAAWSNGLLRDNGYLVNGNAWSLGNVDILFNGYDGLTRPETYDSRVVTDYNHAATDNVFKNFDSKTLDTSKPYIVNMYYNNSPVLEEAYNNGKGVTGTHTGILTFDPEIKKWYVTHNIHGNIHQEPFGELLKSSSPYGVTAIYAPREKTLWNRVKGFFGFANGGQMDKGPIANMFLTGGPKITYGKPYYSYDNNGKKVDNTLNYNATLPEVVITPDSKKSPGERAVLERERRRTHDAIYGLGTYNANLNRDYTATQVARSNNAWNNSTKKKALDVGETITSGIKAAADFVPVAGDMLQGLEAAKDAANGNYLSAGAGAAGLLIPNALEKPAKWLLKGVSKRSGSQLGDAVLRFIGEDPSYRVATGTPMAREGLSKSESDLLDVFEARGIDSSIFTPEDLHEALNLRRLEVRSSVPGGKRFSYIETDPAGYTINDMKGYDQAGYMNLVEGPNNGFRVDMVENLNPDRFSGVSQRGYDAAIRLARSTGRDGVVSGERLLMPEATTHIWEHYPNKKQIGTYGVWGPDDATAIEGNPVYMLDEPSKLRLAKSDIFDPIILNNEGDMNVFWDKSNLMWKYGGKMNTYLTGRVKRR